MRNRIVEQPLCMYQSGVLYYVTGWSLEEINVFYDFWLASLRDANYWCWISLF